MLDDSETLKLNDLRKIHTYFIQDWWFEIIYNMIKDGT
jgi:hypothetical protein